MRDTTESLTSVKFTLEDWERVESDMVNAEKAARHFVEELGNLYDEGEIQRQKARFKFFASRRFPLACQEWVARAFEDALTRIRIIFDTDQPVADLAHLWRFEQKAHAIWVITSPWWREPKVVRLRKQDLFEPQKVFVEFSIPSWFFPEFAGFWEELVAIKFGETEMGVSP